MFLKNKLFLHNTNIYRDTECLKIREKCNRTLMFHIVHFRPFLLIDDNYVCEWPK